MDFFFSSPGRRKSRLATQHLELMLRASSKSFKELRQNMISYEQYMAVDDPAAAQLSTKKINAIKYCAAVSEVREDLYMIDGTCRLVRRVFINCHDSGAYNCLGWVLSKDVEHCMLCSATFSSSWRFKHHCRCCGNVVCEKCSPDSARATLDSLPDCGLQRVCIQCNYGQSVVKVIGNHMRGLPIVCNPEVEMTMSVHLMKPRLVLKVICMPDEEEDDDNDEVPRSVFINVGTCDAVPLRRSSFIADGKEPSSGGRNSCTSLEDATGGRSRSPSVVPIGDSQHFTARSSKSSNASLSRASQSSAGRTLGSSLRKRAKSITADIDFICMVGGKKKATRESNISVYDVAVNPASIPAGQMENFTAKAEELFEQVVDFVRRVYAEDTMGGYCSDHSSVYYHAQWTRDENQRFAQELNIRALKSGTFAYLIAEPVELMVPTAHNAFAVHRDYQLPPPRLYRPSQWSKISGGECDTIERPETPPPKGGQLSLQLPS